MEIAPLSGYTSAIENPKFDAVFRYLLRSINKQASIELPVALEHVSNHDSPGLPMPVGSGTILIRGQAKSKRVALADLPSHDNIRSNL